MAALAAWHESHEPAARALEGISAIPAHVMLEAYSVLTRLPGGLAVPPSAAADVLKRRFPTLLRHRHPDDGALLGTLSAAGVFGGASYDGLVALQARGHVLLTLDRRAQETYRRLGAPFEVVS